MAMDATNRLSAIAAEMGQLQNEIDFYTILYTILYYTIHRVLNFLLISVRTIDPARKEARIRATRERIEGGEAASAAGGAASAHCSWSTRSPGRLE
jgi:hypothetical protein